MSIVGTLLVRVSYAQPEVTFYAYEPTGSLHTFGSKQGEFEWGAASDLGAGFLTYGSSSSKLTNGAFEARYALSVDNNSADDTVIAFVDVYDDTGNIEIARREIHRKEFARANVFQNFPLSFISTGTNKLEFRVFVFGKSFVAHEWTKVIRYSEFAETTLCSRQHILEHRPGRAKGDGCISNNSDQAGRSATQVVDVGTRPAGNYSAKFSLRIDDNSKDDSNVAVLTVHTKATNSILATLAVMRKDFLMSRSTQGFELPFEFDGVGKLEFRIFVRKTAHIQCQAIAISSALSTSYRGADAALRHQLGTSINGSWLAKKSDGAGYLTFGPNTRSVPPGVATVTFSLLIDDNQQNNDTVALLDAYDSVSGKVLAQRRIKRKDFNAPQSAQDFDLEFEIAQSSTLEFRVFTYGLADLNHFSTTVTPDRLTLAALWNAQAHWEYRKRDIFSFQGIQDYAPSSLISLDGIWYAFNRVPATKVDETQSKTCTSKGAPPLQIVVRSSADHAVTWSAPVVVAMPSSSPHSSDYCEIVDGGAFFDPETDVWHYLAQCVNPPANWSMCHYTRSGISPMGTFLPDSANPVVVGGQLWSKICKGKTEDCPTTMKDEGTPQILGKSSDGYFYVTFHGANYGSIVTGARGVARTRDFIGWQVRGDDLPGNPMLTLRDCKYWHAGWSQGGCIGEGDARIIRSDGRYYILTEATDKSLNCKPGQQWVFGLLRNSSLGASGSWQNYKENPFIVNENISPAGCALDYMNFVRDRGELFLEFSLYSPNYPYPNYIYQLVNGRPDSGVMRVR